MLFYEFLYVRDSEVLIYILLVCMYERGEGDCKGDFIFMYGAGEGVLCIGGLVLLALYLSQILYYNFFACLDWSSRL